MEVLVIALLVLVASTVFWRPSGLGGDDSTEPVTPPRGE